jgi:hypothetical protein
MLAFCITLSACGKIEKYDPIAVVFIVSDKMGGESPGAYIQFLPDDILNRAVAEGSVYAVVSVSSNPGISHTVIPEYTAVTAQQYRKDHSFFLSRLKSDIREKSKPQDGGSDLLKAISMGVDFLRNTPSELEWHMVVIDNMLTTDGEFKFDNNSIHAYFTGERNLINNRIEITAEYLIENKIMPNLSGVILHVAGCGHTSLPQQPLSSLQKSLLWDFWHKIFIVADAKEIINIAGQTGIMSNSTLPVTLLDFPVRERLEFERDETDNSAGEDYHVVDVEKELDIVHEPIFLDERKVGFIPNTDIYRDEQETLDVLTPIAELLLEERNMGISLLLVGCTAGDGNNTFTLELSLARSNRVKLSLESLGLSSYRLHAVGLGSENKWHIPGLSTSDPLSQMNRQVVLLRADSETAIEILHNIN